MEIDMGATESGTAPLYWLLLDAKAHGPYAPTAVIELLRSGRVTSETSAAEVGVRSWRRLREIPAFAGVCGAEPGQGGADPGLHAAGAAGWAGLCWLGLYNPLSWVLIVSTFLHRFPVVTISVLAGLIGLGFLAHETAERPVPPPHPLPLTGRALPVAVGCRGAINARHGIVAVVTSQPGCPVLPQVWFRTGGPAPGPWKHLGRLKPGGKVEAGWLEIGAPLRQGTPIELWADGFDLLQATL
jgi:hypothetical protein